MHKQISGAMAKSPADALRPGKPLTLAQCRRRRRRAGAGRSRARSSRRAPMRRRFLGVICRDGQRMAGATRALAFFGPDIAVLEFPAWDCLPYDRVSPIASVVAQRMTALSRLTRVKGRDRPSRAAHHVNAATPTRAGAGIRSAHALSVAPGIVLGMHGVIEWLNSTASRALPPCASRASTQVRGGILDLFPPGLDMPVRFDFFGERAGDHPQLRSADATQRIESARARSGAGGRIPVDYRNHPPLPHRLCREFGATRPATCCTRR